VWDELLLIGIVYEIPRLEIKVVAAAISFEIAT
jgi:hypothetical protein